MSDSDKVPPVQAILRWIAVLPASLLGAGIAHAIFILPHKFGEGDVSVWKEIIVSGIFGAAFVAIGQEVAPSHKKIVSTVLAGMVLFFSGMLMTGLIERAFLAGILGSIAMIIGSIVVCVNTWQDD